MNEMGRYALLFICAIAIAAIIYAFLLWSGIQIPSIIITVFWILIGAIICAMAVKIIIRIMQSP